MKTLDIDSHDEKHPLGKPIREAPAPTPEAYEKFTGKHGDTLWRNRRTGAVRTDDPNPPPPVPLPPIVDPWNQFLTAYTAALPIVIAAQEDDGFSIHEFGIM